MTGQSRAPSPPFVDLNAADRAELAAMLPGIGPKLADRIVSFREGHGPFSEASDLARVPGIGARLAEKLSPTVSFAPSPILSSPPPDTSIAVERAVPHIDTLRGPAFADETHDVSTPGGVFVFESDARGARDPFGLDSSPGGEASSMPETTDDGRVIARASVPPVREKRGGVGRFALAAMVVLGALVGLGAGIHSERRAAGLTKEGLERVDHEVEALRADDGKAAARLDEQATELARQAAELAAAKESLRVAIAAEAASVAKVEARTQRVSEEVSELAERTRREQARLDGKVYRLDEAVRLIDWATTAGYVRQVANDGPAVSPK
jgi:competence ComEA-like helix-hairpin-helix protein